MCSGRANTRCTQDPLKDAPQEAAGVPERPEDREEVNKGKDILAMKLPHAFKKPITVIPLRQNKDS